MRATTAQQASEKGAAETKGKYLNGLKTLRNAGEREGGGKRP